MDLTMKLERSTAPSPEFLTLACQLDAYLRGMDGDEHVFYAQFNHADALKNMVIAWDETVRRWTWVHSSRMPMVW